MWIISLPVVAAQVSPSGPLNILDFFGLAGLDIGFYFEAAGDYQLARFKSNPENKGKVLDNGVWKYSRHPNYFGDAFQWWGFFLLALSAGYWWTVISPVIMTLLLIRVSGVALLEKTLKETKPGYREYVENTSAFISNATTEKAVIYEWGEKMKIVIFLAVLGILAMTGILGFAFIIGRFLRGRCGVVAATLGNRLAG